MKLLKQVKHRRMYDAHRSNSQRHAMHSNKKVTLWDVATMPESTFVTTCIIKVLLPARIYVAS